MRLSLPLSVPACPADQDPRLALQSRLQQPGSRYSLFQHLKKIK